MKNAAADFYKAVDELHTAASKRDSGKASVALSKVYAAFQTVITVGELENLQV